jgi:CRP/FNR family transcriptional regulator, cyclic AMP receptor protein
MDTIVTDQRKWSRAEVAELLISKNALAELKLSDALQIVRLLTPQRVAAGTILIEEGVTTTGFMALVLQGDAVVINSIRGTDDSVLLSQLGPGAVFGELGVMDAKPRSATVTAVTDMDIAVLDRPALARLIETVPSVACALLVAIMVRMSDRLRATNEKVKSLSEANASLQEALHIAKNPARS